MRDDRRRVRPSKPMFPMMVVPMMLMLGVLVLHFLIWRRLSKIEGRLAETAK